MALRPARGARRGDDQIVVKDPHAFWFAQAWESVSAELGRRPALADRAAPPGRGRRLARHRLPLQPVRGPAADQGDVQRRRLGARRAAHRAGRPRPQAVLRQLRRPARRLARGAGAGPAAARARPSTPTSPPRDHHAVDDFIEPSMRKSQLTWDDVATPDWLRDMAEEVWQLLGVLTTSPHDADTLAAPRPDPRRLQRALRRRGRAHLRPHPGRVDARRARGPRRAARHRPAAAPRPRAGTPRTARRTPTVGGREAAAILRRAVVRRVTRR